MIDVSKFVSNRWKDESNEVKEAYMKIAKEIDVELKEKRKHDKKCPVIWKIDKESKKQKRKSKKNLTNNNLNNDNNDINNNNNNNNNINSNNNDKDKNSNNSLNKFRNTTTTTDITFEFQNFSILDNENDQKNLRSLERVESSQSPQSSLGNSPYPLINLSGIIPTCNFVNYDMESPSNESEEDNLDCQHPTYSLSNCDQMLDPLYCSRLNTIESPHQIHATSQGYENFVYSLHDNGIFAPQYGWEPCINGGNLTCQQVNQFQ